MNNTIIPEDELFEVPARNISEEMNVLLEKGARKTLREPRTYLGASLMGDPCPQRMVYILKGVEPDQPESADQLRTFAIGHQLETLVANELRRSGFYLQTEQDLGGPLGFSVDDGKIQGHIDGQILRGPLQVDYPLLWECKTLKASSWRELQKHKCEVAFSRYYAQIQIYMHYMNYKYCLLTCLNKDTSELYHELVPYEEKAAVSCVERAHEILECVEQNQEAPRLGRNPDFYECRVCRFHDRCWPKNSEASQKNFPCGLEPRRHGT